MVARDPEALARFMNAEVADNLVLPVYNASPGQVLPAILDIQPSRIVPAVCGFRRPGAGRRPAAAARVDTTPLRRHYPCCDSRQTLLFPFIRTCVQLVSVSQKTPLADVDSGATGERATFIHYKSNRNGSG